ncbi:MAG: SDR family NAD(P)-dependent oxidoreductase [Rickettsiaceae bacterium]|nr:SDR family NAD(P)-dependent oxidoreductase [Rickettsiaceae bacterium]
MKGYEIDWNLLHQGEAHQKISLPTYPFLKKKCWFPEKQVNLPSNSFQLSMEGAYKLHPLVGYNTSTFTEQSFRTILKEEDFYLRDHIVVNQKVLPGVAHLEMARAAAELALPGSEIRELQNIRWVKPLVAKEEKIEVSLRLEEHEGKISFTIYSLKEGEELIYSQGILLYGDRKEINAWSNPSILKDKLLHVYHKEEIYQYFNKFGLHLGKTFQVLEWVKTNGKEVLGYYQLPAEIKDKNEELYFFYPSILDGTLQASVGYMLNDGQQANLVVPFALERIILHHRLPSEGYSHIRRTVGKDMMFDIQVLDKEGRVCAELQGLSVRPITAEAFHESKIDLHYYQAQWIPTHLPAKDKGLSLQSLCVISKDKPLVNQLRTRLSGLPIIHLQEGAQYTQIDNNTYQLRMKEAEDWHAFIKDIQQQGIHLSHFIFGKDFRKLFKNGIDYIDTSLHEIVIFIQTLMKEKISGSLKFVMPYGYREELLSPSSMLTGFAKSLHQEHPQYQMQIVGFDDSIAPESQLEAFIAELEQGLDFHVRYVKGERLVERYLPLISKEESKDLSTSLISLRQEGIYLITGGLGGLGFIFAEYLAKIYQAKLILTGRSELTEDKQNQIEQLEQLGASVLYLSGDVSDKAIVESWIASSKSHFGSLHGIIHSAGIIEDQLLLQKAWPNFRSILLPKVLGALHLDIATQTENLDFFVVFSSVASCLGNAGQTDYATANAFLDQFVEWRENQKQQNQRQGKSLSINWPYWAEGGMRMDSQQSLRNWGIEALPNAEGIKAFMDGLFSDSVSQLMVLYGKEQRLKVLLGELTHIRPGRLSKKEDILKEGTTSLKIFGDQNRIISSLIEDLASDVVEVLKLPLGSVDILKDLGDYGFNSITFTELANKLKQRYEFSVTPALFFEYNTIEKFADYLWQTHEQDLITRYATPQESNSVSEKGGSSSLTPLRSITSSVNLSNRFLKHQNQQAYSEATFTHSDIAVIGMAGRFPGSENLQSFWQNLIEQKDLITEVPKERFDYKEHSIPKWGGFIADIDKFDPLFFNISPKEAELMDPQQRIFLQSVWQAIEDAGYAVEHLSKYKTGLFVGVSTVDYGYLLNEANVIEAYTSTGNAHSILANRVSYILNLKGPSEAIDTACASSLFAIHHAVRALQQGDCELAIAGGVNALLSPSVFISFTQAGMLSEDGRCKTFDKAANGYVRGEGVGVILLKPLRQALADNDRIYGVIKGVSTNHGGHVNTLTTPNPNAQAELIIEAYESNKINPNTITYIEAHGTGTSLGDPIEVNGLKRAFRELSKKQEVTLGNGYCGIGAVKTNIGHLEAAAGIAGFIKSLLMFQYKKLPGQVHFKDLNPYIELDNSPFYIVSETKDWVSKDTRRIGISSFGFGGANAHVVIEEGPEYVLSSEQNKPCYLITLSAKHPDSLRQRTEDLHDYLKKHPESPLEAIAYTLNIGRSHFDYRCALVVSSIKELQEKLEKVQENQQLKGFFKGDAKQKVDDQEIYERVLKGILEELKAQSIEEISEYKKQLEALANLYIKGYDLDWHLLHHGEAHQKISLPTYPFLKERYWIAADDSNPGVNRQLGSAQHRPGIKSYLHPLLQENTSNIAEECRS